MTTEDESSRLPAREPVPNDTRLLTPEQIDRVACMLHDTEDSSLCDGDVRQLLSHIKALEDAARQPVPAAGECETCAWIEASAIPQPGGMGRHVGVDWTRHAGFSVQMTEFGKKRLSIGGAGSTLAAAVAAARSAEARG